MRAPHGEHTKEDIERDVGNYEVQIVKRSQYERKAPVRYIPQFQVSSDSRSKRGRRSSGGGGRVSRNRTQEEAPSYRRNTSGSSRFMVNQDRSTTLHKDKRADECFTYPTPCSPSSPTFNNRDSTAFNDRDSTESESESPSLNELEKKCFALKESLLERQVLHRVVMTGIMVVMVLEKWPTIGYPIKVNELKAGALSSTEKMLGCRFDGNLISDEVTDHDLDSVMAGMDDLVLNVEKEADWILYFMANHELITMMDQYRRKFERRSRE